MYNNVNAPESGGNYTWDLPTQLRRILATEPKAPDTGPISVHYGIWPKGLLSIRDMIKGNEHMSAIFSFDFSNKSLVHLKCYILIQTPSQSDIWLQRYKQFFKLKNNVKHKNLTPLLACNSKSLFPTSDSFP